MIRLFPGYRFALACIMTLCGVSAIQQNGPTGLALGIVIFAIAAWLMASKLLKVLGLFVLKLFISVVAAF